MTIQVNDMQRAQIMEVVELASWSDLVGAVNTLDFALRLALELTVDDVPPYRDDGGDLRTGDASPQSPVEVLSEDARRAHVAGLVYLAVLMWGLATGHGSEAAGEPRDRDIGSPRWLITRLAGIVVPDLGATSGFGVADGEIEVPIEVSAEQLELFPIPGRSHGRT